MNLLHWGHKPVQFYQGLMIKADLGLHAQIAQMLRRELPGGGLVLDLGAGEGALCARLADLGYRMVAADKKADDFKCSRAAFECLDFDRPKEIEAFVAANEGRFDAVLGIEVIEHVQDPWQYARRLLRMARPGGLVLVTTPNTTSWLSRLQFLFTGRFHQFGPADLRYGHINPMTPYELEQVLSAAGAHELRVTPAGTLPPLYLSGIDRVTAFSLLALLLRPFMRGAVLDGWCVMATGRKPIRDA